MEDSLYRQAVEISKPPPEAYSLIPGEDLILSLGGKHPLRNIFSVSPFLEFEVEKLKRLKDEIVKSKLKCPDFMDDAFLLRIIHGSGYKTRKAFKDLKKSIEAYKLLVPTDIRLLYSKIFKVLKTGFLYISGRDKYYRPAVILDCTRFDVKAFSIEQYIDATVFLMEFVITHMLIPGKVENWVSLVEMNKQGLTELPIKPLMKYSAVLQDVYKCRLAHSFIINPPSSIYYIWRVCSPFIDKVTQSKIIIVKEGISKEMMNLYDKSQLEKRFGGTSENNTNFWPPVFPTETYKQETNLIEERGKKKLTVVKNKEESEHESSKEDSIISQSESRHSEQEVLHEEFEIITGRIDLNNQQEDLEDSQEELKNVEIEIKSEFKIDENEKFEKKKRRKEKREKRKKRKDRDAKIEEEKVSDSQYYETIIDPLENKSIIGGNVVPEVHESVPICGCEANKCATF